MESDEFSVRLYGFEREPLLAFHAESRGDGNPLPILAALCKPNGWIAIDDASGKHIDLAGVTAAG